MENITVVVKRQPLALCIANAKPTNSIIFGFQNITTKMLNTRIHNFDPILLLKFKNYHCMNSEQKAYSSILCYVFCVHMRDVVTTASS
ncbi:hypothetical protein T4B_5354 [Trichinella pseudospiralis]|uniref:Uncharacterized protein n=1 Tax=Trichinella pseudospiralis TaxID=6337 RepID=A0A0V1E7T3_TRIPS|nr:hypothetical protein T4A_729 [Trichinella pseudospiralis]KRZ04382.1 hypothetical protein T4B_5354 [Trichinella pseudospiralis]